MVKRYNKDSTMNLRRSKQKTLVPKMDGTAKGKLMQRSSQKTNGGGQKPGKWWDLKKHQ